MEADKERFKNGPIAERSCTDIICCLIFIVGIVGFIGGSWYGWTKGDPAQLFIGWDSDGNGCGLSEATKDYPYLYFSEAPGEKVLESI